MKKNNKVMIIGFAPSSRDLAPIDDSGFDIWALNELYLEMPRLETNAHSWFQLHGVEPPKLRDPNQTARLGKMPFPIYMWRKHPQIQNSMEYPLAEIIEYFDLYGQGMAPDIFDKRDRAYFTNTISWMIALAIYEGYEEIHVYGVDMAQDQEYAHQRPSCEFFLGWARGAGIKIYLPPQSDLLKTSLLYGYDDADQFRQKLEARKSELDRRRAEVRAEINKRQNEINQLNAVDNQLAGALQDNDYMIKLAPPRRWTKDETTT